MRGLPVQRWGREFSQLAWLGLIDASADALALDMDFQPGDIQLLNNSTMLHGRAAYEDWEEPARKRHPLRLWINADNPFEDEGNIVKAEQQKSVAVSDSDLL